MQTKVGVLGEQTKETSGCKWNNLQKYAIRKLVVETVSVGTNIFKCSDFRYSV